MLKIKELRIEKGFTQKKLAEKVNTTNKNIWAYENGLSEPSIETLVKFANVFNVSVDYLLEIDDDFGNVVGESTLTKDEQRLLVAFDKSSDDFKEKIIEFAELCAGVDVVKK